METVNAIEFPAVKSSEELLIELRELPEKSASAARVIAALQKAKQKRERKATRNLINIGRGGYQGCSRA